LPFADGTNPSILSVECTIGIKSVWEKLILGALLRMAKKENPLVVGTLSRCSFAATRLGDQ
jgi:hypothetical protein